jgi:hypothetical protein
MRKKLFELVAEIDQAAILAPKMGPNGPILMGPFWPH